MCKVLPAPEQLATKSPAQQVCIPLSVTAGASAAAATAAAAAAAAAAPRGEADFVTVPLEEGQRQQLQQQVEALQPSATPRSPSSSLLRKLLGLPLGHGHNRSAPSAGATPRHDEAQCAAGAIAAVSGGGAACHQAAADGNDPRAGLALQQPLAAAAGHQHPQALSAAKLAMLNAASAASSHPAPSLASVSVASLTDSCDGDKSGSSERQRGDGGGFDAVSLGAASIAPA